MSNSQLTKFPSNKRKLSEMLSGKISPSGIFSRSQAEKSSHVEIFPKKCTAMRQTKNSDDMLLCCLFDIFLSFFFIQIKLKQTTIFFRYVQQNSARILIKNITECTVFVFWSSICVVTHVMIIKFRFDFPFFRKCEIEFEAFMAPKSVFGKQCDVETWLGFSKV